MRTILLAILMLGGFLIGTGAARDYPWCSRLDDVFARVEGGDLVLHHLLATYNCCPDSFTFTLETEGDSLFVTEYEVLTTPCDCLCCFNLAVTVTDLPAGDWNVVYRWLDDEPYGWRDWHLTVNLDGALKDGPGRIAATGFTGCLEESEVPGGGSAPRNGIRLYANAPNPFNPQTTIAFDLTRESHVTLSVFDMAGRVVRTLIDDESHGPGHHEEVWRGRDETGRPCASGTYFYRLETDDSAATKRMVLLR